MLARVWVSLSSIDHCSSEFAASAPMLITLALFWRGKRKYRILSSRIMGDEQAMKEQGGCHLDSLVSNVVVKRSKIMMIMSKWQ